jgi:hypothetical protein
VTNVLNAYHCPVASLHNLMHDSESYQEVQARGRPDEQWLGNEFHKFIARIKSGLVEGTLSVGGSSGNLLLRQEFLRFARGLANPDRIWNLYLEDWSTRKIPELEKLHNKSRLFFEMWVASPHVSFALQGGQRNYPVQGRIDEIDLDNKRIVERTLRRGDSNTPPYLKDYQVWLLWKILRSIPSLMYPEGWQNIDFAEFDLIVETPSQDYPIARDNPQFETKTHEAFAWIHDICFDPRGAGEAYRYKKQFCQPGNVPHNCGLTNVCYGRKWTYPSARDEMRREFRDIYRSLLWETIWTYDLLQYKFVMLSTGDLERQGLIASGRIVDRQNNEVRVEVPPSQTNPIWTQSFDEKRFLLVPYGNLAVGLRLGGTVKRESGNVFKVKFERVPIPISGSTLIAPVSPEFRILKDEPVYLIRRLQSDLHSLQRMGGNDQVKTGSDSIIQLLEGLFGRKRMKTGVENS